MAGHSHFHNIKHKKGRADTIRGKVFSKLSKLITICAKDRGGDITTNSQLRLVIEKAKEANMPKENIEKAIKKGTGEIKSEKMDILNFEILGANGIGFIVEAITDNKNRTTSQIKVIVNKNNFKFAGEGAVKWMFEYKGIIEIENIPNDKQEDVEMIIIDSGADDFIWYKNEEGFNNLNIYTQADALELVKTKIESSNLKVKNPKLGWKAKELIEVKEKNEAKIIKFLEDLNDNDDVQEIYFNFI